MQTASSDYVLGLEPGNVGVRGRSFEQDAGTLPMLEPGETRRFTLTFELSSLQRPLEDTYA